MNDRLLQALKAAARTEGGMQVIGLRELRGLASEAGLPPREAEIASLRAGVVPSRYLRNIGTLGLEGQARLLESCVGVCGLGGLGGYVVECLARYGIGRLILADGETFVESNLNRQILCREEDLGRPKVEVARERVAAVNPSLEVTTHFRFLTADDVPETFGEAQVVVDALDTVSSRLDLEAGCRRLGIPMVHGAIAGNCGQVMTVYPGDPGLRAVYLKGEDHGTELVEGNPPTTPALVAALQAQEVVKVLCGGDTLRGELLFLDTYSNFIRFIPLE